MKNLTIILISFDYDSTRNIDFIKYSFDRDDRITVTSCAARWVEIKANFVPSRWKHINNPPFEEKRLQKIKRKNLKRCEKRKEWKVNKKGIEKKDREDYQIVNSI